MVPVPIGVTLLPVSGCRIHLCPFRYQGMYGAGIQMLLFKLHWQGVVEIQIVAYYSHSYYSHSPLSRRPWVYYTPPSSIRV